MEKTGTFSRFGCLDCRTLECIEHINSWTTSIQLKSAKTSSDPSSTLFGERLNDSSLQQENILSEIMEPLQPANNGGEFEVRERSNYLKLAVAPTLTAALEQLVRERPSDPVIWLADWLTIHNPYSVH